MPIIFLILLLFNLPLFSQTRVSATASVYIVPRNDTSYVINTVIPTLETGLTPNQTIDVLGYPNERIYLRYGKQKWVYDNYYIYFDNKKIDLIVKFPIDTIKNYEK